MSDGVASPTRLPPIPADATFHFRGRPPVAGGTKANDGTLFAECDNTKAEARIKTSLTYVPQLPPEWEDFTAMATCPAGHDERSRLHSEPESSSEGMILVYFGENHPNG